MQGIGVVVVNFNSGALLGRCLDSMERQTLRPAQVVVVDNASTDGSERAADGRDGVALLRCGWNSGFAAATNAGIAALVDCAWIATLNPDAEADPGWLAALHEGCTAQPGYAMFASRLVDAADSGRLDGVGDAYHVCGLPWRRAHGRPDGPRWQRPQEVFGPCAAAALYSRAALTRCGGFDEELFCYVEDVDLAFRMRLLGMRCLYLPGAVVHHIGSAIAGRASEFQIYHGHRNLVWVFVRNMPGVLFWLLLPLHLLLNVVSVAWFAVRGRSGAILRAKRDALRGLPSVWRKRRSTQRSRVVSSGAIWRALDKSPLGDWRESVPW